MASIVQIPNRDYYIKSRGRYDLKYLVKRYGKVGLVFMGNITFPKKFIGKKVRIKVELV